MNIVKAIKEKTFDKIIKGFEDKHVNYVYYKGASEEFIACDNPKGHGVVIINNDLNKSINDKFDNIDELFDWYTEENTAGNYRIQFVCFAEWGDRYD